MLGDGIQGRSGFLRRHEPERDIWTEAVDEVPTPAAYDGPLAFVPYGNIAAMFAGSPADHERPIYGRVATRGDGSTRNRRAGRPGSLLPPLALKPKISLPDDLLLDRYRQRG